MPTLCESRQRGACLAGIFAGGEGFIGLGDVDQVMRDAGAIFTRRLGGANFKVPIYSNRIATDNLSEEPLSERDGESGLPRGRRSEDDDKKRINGAGRLCGHSPRAPCSAAWRS